MIAIVRGYCGEDALEKSWGPQKMDVPKAPGVGLFLEDVRIIKDLFQSPLWHVKKQSTPMTALN